MTPSTAATASAVVAAGDQHQPAHLRDDARGCRIEWLVVFRRGIASCSSGRRSETVKVAAEETGERLDRVLAAHVELSRSRLKALILDGRVAIERAHDPRSGPPRQRRRRPSASTLPPPEDAEPRGRGHPARPSSTRTTHLIVIDKPAGLVVHPAAGNRTGTLVNALIAHCGASLSGIGGVRRPGIVHRLDKDTTGLMVVAKTDRAHQRARRPVRRPRPQTGRSSAAIWPSSGACRTGPKGTIDKPLDRHPRARDKMAVRAGGREAVTHWEVLERYPGADGKPVASLLACRLETGRTHQIRVHLASIGHPLLGDDVYGPGFKTKMQHLGPEARAAA